MIEALPILPMPYPALLPEAVTFLPATGAAGALVRAARRSAEPFTFAVFALEDSGLMRIGCAAVVEQVIVEHGQLLGMRVRGLARVELLGPVEGEAPLALVSPVAQASRVAQARVRVLDAPAPVDALLRAQLARVKTRLPGMDLALDADALAAIEAIEEPGRFADALAAQLDELTLEHRVALLTTLVPAVRLALVDRLLDAVAIPPKRELGRVWAVLRDPCDAVPSHASLRARAGDIDTNTLTDLRLRAAVEELARARPILLVDVDDSRELEARRESLSQLTSAVRALEALRACGGPEDADVQAEIAAAVTFVLIVAAREREAIDRS